MDNATRSDITRKKAIEAALAILARDGLGGLTFDALSKESGVSRGGLIHQFGNKEGVIAALLSHQRNAFARIAEEHTKHAGANKNEKTLSALLATHKASANQPLSVGRVILAALVEFPHLSDDVREPHQKMLKMVREEASDEDLSILRYYAASGLALSMLLGLTSVPKATANRLFDRLMDEDRWHIEE